MYPCTFPRLPHYDQSSESLYLIFSLISGKWGSCILKTCKMYIYYL